MIPDLMTDAWQSGICLRLEANATLSVSYFWTHLCGACLMEWVLGTGNGLLPLHSSKLNRLESSNIMAY